MLNKQGLFNKIIAEKFSNIENKVDIQMQEPFRTPNMHKQRRKSPWHIIVRMVKMLSKETLQKVALGNVSSHTIAGILQ